MPRVAACLPVRAAMQAFFYFMQIALFMMGPLSYWLTWLGFFQLDSSNSTTTYAAAYRALSLPCCCASFLSPHIAGVCRHSTPLTNTSRPFSPPSCCSHSCSYYFSSAHFSCGFGKAHFSSASCAAHDHVDALTGLSRCGGVFFTSVGCASDCRCPLSLVLLSIRFTRSLSARLQVPHQPLGCPSTFCASIGRTELQGGLRSRGA